jgi:segregation and condensation protein B
LAAKGVGDMADSIAVVPELKQIVGAMIFAANRPLRVEEIKECLDAVAEREKGALAVFASVGEVEIRAAVDELKSAMAERGIGFRVVGWGGGFKLQSDAAGGVWLKDFLAIGPRNRLSMPALETLAIIAYRQPIGRSEIEAVRGVNVDHMIRILLELQLIRICGRSDLPGRPFLYGTTAAFLEHFGLKDIKELADMEPMLAQWKKAAAKAEEPVHVQQADTPAAESAGPDRPDRPEPAEPAQ